MQYKINYWLLSLLMLVLVGCTEKEAPVLEPPTLTAHAATDVTRFSVVLSGNIKLTGSSTVKEYGLAYSTVSSMAEENTEHIRISYNSSQNTYEVKLDNLTPGTTYFYRFYANNGYTEVYSEKLSFTTKETDVPVLDVVTLVAAAENSVEVKCKLMDDGGSTLSQYGFAYKKVGAAEEKQAPATNKNDAGEFSLMIGDLDHSSKYEVRAYAVNGKGPGYSEKVEVSTSTPETPVLKLTVSESDYKSIIVSATLQNAGIAEGVTEVGFYWSKEQGDPAVNGKQVIAKLENNSFTTTIADLEQNTIYYIKAYAVNRTVTGYSDVVSATTGRRTVPVLGALTLVSANEKALVITGTIIDNGGSDIKSLGYCYELPNTGEEIRSEIALNKLNTDGSFQFTIAGLQPGSNYQVRAFAVNDAGTGYSSYSSLTTKEQNSPAVSLSVLQYTSTSISLSAVVTDKGSTTTALTETGFVYSKTNATPTVADTKVVVGDAQENFSTVLNNLEKGTTYYIRAYAKNETKTGYSEVKMVSTAQSDAPQLAAVTVTGITENSATVTGKVTDNGNNNLTAIGFRYKTSTGTEMQYDVDLADLKNDNTFTATLTGLTPGTIYQIRAYATNKEGVGYGEYTTFTTSALVPPTLTLSYDTESLTAVSVGLNAVIQSIGNASGNIKEVGFCWSKTNPTPTKADNPTAASLNGSTFATTLSGLKGETKYYIRAYAVNESTIGYSNVITVTTPASNVPDIDDNPSPEM